MEHSGTPVQCGHYWLDLISALWFPCGHTSPGFHIAHTDAQCGKTPKHAKEMQFKKHKEKTMQNVQSTQNVKVYTVIKMLVN